MNHYIFELGREPQLSIAEIKAVLSLWQIPYQGQQKQHFFLVETGVTIDIHALMDCLGGTIKIAWQLPAAASVAETIVAHLGRSDGKIVFSLTSPGGQKQALAIKKQLQALGRSVRYIPPKNTATILHNNLVARKSDITIIDNLVYATSAIQPIEELSWRDYGRPGRSSRRGMLPPKLAKMLINLAQIPATARLLDPFCGSGTIITEAALMGYTDLIGSDIDAQAIEATEQNLSWMQKTYKLNFACELFRSDVMNLATHLAPHSIAAIITEPYLGKPLFGNETKTFLLKQAAELQQLYIRAFQSFHSLLVSGGVVLCVLPAFAFGGEDWIHMDCKPAIEKIGFTAISFDEATPYLLYARPDQHVGREIWKFVSA